MNKKCIFTVIGGIAGITAAFIAGRKSAENKANETYDKAMKAVEETTEEMEFLAYENAKYKDERDEIREQLTDAVSRINFLEEELTGANEEIDKLRKSGKNSK